MTDNNENKVLNVPHLRFPKFSGEWEICKVSELLDFYSTNSLSWEQLEYGEKAMMNLHYGLIHVGLPTMVDLRRDKLPNVKEGNMPKNFELCKEGDVAFADASEDTNEVAKSLSCLILIIRILFVVYTQFMGETIKIKLLSASKDMLFRHPHFIIRLDE